MAMTDTEHFIQSIKNDNHRRIVDRVVLDFHYRPLQNDKFIERKYKDVCKCDLCTCTHPNTIYREYLF